MHAEHRVGDQMIDSWQGDCQRQFADHFGQIIRAQTIRSTLALFINNFSFGRDCINNKIIIIDQCLNRCIIYLYNNIAIYVLYDVHIIIL